MKHKRVKKIMSVFLVIALMLSTVACGSDSADAQTGNTEKREEILADTASMLLENTEHPAYGTVGGEWLVLGLSRWDGEVPQEWYDSYYENVGAYVKECKGVLDERKYTEFSRVIIALSAIGKNPADVAGYNLLTPLADFEQTTFQGINGPVYALLALDSGNYNIPQITTENTQATREMYIDYILSLESECGGWSLSGGDAEADITAMVLQALAKYKDQQDVSDAIERAITVLSEQQNENGGFISYDAESSETISQVIVALSELGISISDERFVKNGHSLEERLLEFMTDDFSFKHVLDGEGDMIATEQAFYALVELQRAEMGQPSLYHIAKSEQSADNDRKPTCTLEIRCDNLLAHLDEMNKEKVKLVPENGVILEEIEVEFEDGESVFDVFRRVLKDKKIHFEYVDATAYNSVYIEGIANLYEFDCGKLSGWMFSVNDVYPGLGCSAYTLMDGDKIVFRYTCDRGEDLGVEVNDN